MTHTDPHMGQWGRCACFCDNCMVDEGDEEVTCICPECNCSKTYGEG